MISKHSLPHQKMLHFTKSAPPEPRQPTSSKAPPLLNKLLGRVDDSAPRLAMARYIIEQAKENAHQLHLLGPSLHATTVQTVAEAHLLLGDLEQGRTLMQEGLVLRQRLLDREAETETLFLLARHHYHHGAVDETQGYVERMAEAAARAGEHVIELNLLSAVFQIRLERGDQEGAARAMERAVAVARQIGDSDTEMRALVHLGLARHKLGDQESARDLLRQGLAQARAVGDRELEMTVLHSLPTIHFLIGEYVESAEVEVLLVDEARRQRNLVEVRVGLCNIGVSYMVAGQPELALRFLGEALPMLQAEGNREQEAVTRNNLGSCYQHLDQHERAVVELNAALAISAAGVDLKGRHVIIANLATAHTALGHSQRAIPLCHEAIELAREAGDQDREGAMLKMLSELHAGQTVKGRVMQ